MRDGTVAGYAIFEPGAGQPELLLHPGDMRTGLKYSLLPMTQCDHWRTVYAANRQPIILSSSASICYFPMAPA